MVKMPAIKKPGLTFRGNVPAPKCGQPKADGSGPCGAHITKVTIRGKKYQLKTCIMHAPQAIRMELGVAQGGRREGSGRKKIKTPHQVMRERIEADVERYLRPMEDALVAMKAVVVGNGGSAHLEEIEDFTLRLKAINDILDRVYGRPKQVTELSGPDGDAIEVLVPNDDERQRALARVLAATGALNVIPANASASAPSTN